MMEDFLYTALGPWAIVKETDHSAQTKSGLFVPESAAPDRLATGIVMTTGSEVSGFDRGDIVLFDKRHVAPLRLDGEQYWVLTGANAMAKMGVDHE